jgi:hypothetical protein
VAKQIGRSPGCRSSASSSGALFVVEADTVDEAQSVASKHAAANFGEHLGFAVEVRRSDTYETY